MIDNELHVFDCEAKDVFEAIPLSCDRLILTLSSGGRPRMWDIEAGRELEDFFFEDTGFSSAILLPNGHTFALISYDRTVQIWSSDSGECVQTMSFDYEIESAAVCANCFVLSDRCGGFHFFDTRFLA